MDIHASLEEVKRWCAARTAAEDPDRIEVTCHPAIWITISEAVPPWRIRFQRRCSSGASAPLAQLRYDPESQLWALHGAGRPGEAWCSDEEAVHAEEVGALLDAIAADDADRYVGLPAGFDWPFGAE
jgi:hypothetical protein